MVYSAERNIPSKKIPPSHSKVKSPDFQVAPSHNKGNFRIFNMIAGDGIAIIGAGKGGLALLKVLLLIPGVSIKYVCDIRPDSPGMVYAAQHNINCVTNFSQILSDKEVTLVFEATGDEAIFREINEKKSPGLSLIGSRGSKTIFSLIGSYEEVNRNLQTYKNSLEERIIERTEELEVANLGLQKEKEIVDGFLLRQQQVNEDKTRYLLHATHQLKAPFAAIQSFLDIILDGYTGEIPERTRDILLKVITRCKLLTSLINEMLELAKLKSLFGDEANMANAESR